LSSATGINVDVKPAATHAEGLAMLDSGKVTAYFADRSILWVLQANSKAPSNLRLAGEYLTIEPYALGLPKRTTISGWRSTVRLAGSTGQAKLWRSSPEPSEAVSS
jgi:ABC-type amino acid transport substrate-binding protein